MFDFCGKSDVGGRLPLRKGNSTVLGWAARVMDEPANAAKPSVPAVATRHRREIE